MPCFTYRAYGFLVRSEIELPELTPVSGTQSEASALGGLASPPVDIELGEVPARLDRAVQLYPWIAFAEKRWLFEIRNIGRFLVEHGRRMIIEMADGVRESDLRTYILGTGFGVLLHERGLIPLHVSALLSPKGAIAFTGPSGAGKSTAAASLHDALGWPIISDDVAVLSLRNGHPTLQGGVRRLRLWSDALERLQWPTDGLTRDLHRHDKFLVQNNAPFIEGVHPFVALYEIQPAMSNGTLIQVQGGASFQTLMNAIYRPYIAAHSHDRRALQTRISEACRAMRTIMGPRPEPYHINGFTKAL